MSAAGGAAARRPRIAVLKDGFVPDYRLELFERLGQMPDVEYVIVHGQVPSGTAHRAAVGPFGFSEVRSRNREIRLAGKTLVYQPVVRAVSGPSFDGAIIGSELKLLANATLFPLLKAKGRLVMLWGQGAEKQEDVSAAMRMLGGAGAFAKGIAARHADGYLVYTASGKERLVELGVADEKIFVIRNTLNVEGEIELQRNRSHDSEADLRRELGLQPDSTVLLYLGRVYREKRVEEFVSLIGALSPGERGESAVEGVVIGDGPDLEGARRKGEGIDGLHFPGEIRDGDLIARYMRLAAALVIPGKVGLAVNHAFAHGVPVITRAGSLHAPEFEYLEPGRNSIVVAGGFDDFVATVAEFVNSADWQRTLSAGALESRQGLTVASMADSFHRAVCSTLGVLS
jgi:glycosyltransferase involved in cell wall biosynthesis